MRNLFPVCVLSIAFASASSGAGQKPGTYTPVPLIVTVEAADSAGNPCGICADGQGDYIDGQQGVKATIDQYGNIIIDFQTTRTNMRWLTYHYPVTTPVPPSDGLHQHHYLSTIKLGNGVPLQNIPSGGSIYVASCPLFAVDQLEYLHGFYRDCTSGFGSEGSTLRVTRSAINSDEWEVEPEPVVGPGSQLGAWARVFSATTKGRTQIVDYGLMNLPFRMTLTAKH
jgi:hypothetical protein